MKEKQKKIFFKRWFCKHDYKEPDEIRGFFGILQCQKCGNWSQLPDEEMVVKTFKINLTT